MNDRLQKKCFFAATGFHLLLLTILIIGPAFLMSERKMDDMPMLDFVPTKTIDEAFSGGGSPKAQPPAPQPPESKAEIQPPAPPPPTPVRQPDPPKVVVKEKEPDPESLEVKTDKKPRKPEVSLKKVVRNPSTTTSKVASNDDADAKARADATAKQRAAFRKTLNNLNAGLSSSTTIEMPGPGGGGPSYANFYQALRKIYNDAWIVPDGITDDEATVATSVTIARNGDVIATKILRSSGNAAVDASVEAMLRRVTHAVPLPETAKENQRTVNIKFNVKAKLNG